MNLTMTNRQDDGDGTGVAAPDPRRERLKQALRDNLKRRKSQIRERGRPTRPPSTGHETPVDDGSGAERGSTEGGVPGL